MNDDDLGYDAPDQGCGDKCLECHSLVYVNGDCKDPQGLLCDVCWEHEAEEALADHLAWERERDESIRRHDNAIAVSEGMCDYWRV